MKARILSRITLACLLVSALTATIGISISAWNNPTGTTGQQGAAPKNGLIVHEWGTFTSIAGKDGVALEWRPLNGASDLPKFVHTIQDADGGLRHPAKADLTAAVRMETPVVYFYSPSEMDVSAKVGFPKGKITEWYPQASSVGNGINWGQIKVMPNAAVNLPVSYTDSHYYAARETDAAPVQVCGTNGKPPQQEKFLFYRGVGTFDLPLSVKAGQKHIVLRNSGHEEISHLIVFENRGGKIGYRVFDGFSGETTLERLALDQNLDTLLRELKLMLVNSGLYEREAEAMINTWRDSWFEAGLRVFYILPRQTTDAVLPITIDPRPAEMVRVLVGRAEVITPEMEKSVQRQVSKLTDPSPQVRETAMQSIRQYGRFSEPILKQILENEKDEAIRERIRQVIDKAGGKTE
jgi:hypothetical protein